MNASAVLKLSLRLGEGTGAAIAYSVLKGAVAVLSEMTSFEEAQVYNTSHIRMETESAENGDRIMETKTS
jgi:nicotinate-nucleotide--dimethylbenzimidazole phosphoribosyltransferase